MSDTVIKDGTYEIIYAKNPGLALDVIGALDQSGTNIQVFTRNKTPAQKWSITNHSDGVQITCALSGRCMDLANNDLKDGANIRQWEDNNTHAQRWDIVPDGQTVTIDSKSYPTYVIKLHDTDFAADVNGASVTAGTNVQIYAANGTAAQRWAFVPIETFTEVGTYKLVTAANPKMCLDVYGASTATFANIQVYPDNATNAQSWFTFVNDDQTISIVNTKSKKAVDNADGQGEGRNARIYPVNKSIAQCFLAERQGYITYAGQVVPTYCLEIQAGEGGTPVCLDVQGGVANAGTNVFFYHVNGGLNQRWAFIPEAAPSNDLPTPAGLRCTDTNNGTGKTEARFSFSCNFTDYQIRVRFKNRVANTGWKTWSTWKSAFDSLGGNNGWGDEWSANITFPASSSDYKTFTISIPDEYQLDGATNTALQMQVEARSFKIVDETENGTKYHYHLCSWSASTETTFYYVPTVKVTGAYLTGTGLDIAYSSDLLDGGCDVEVYYNGITAKSTGMYGGSGRVEIPCDYLREIPKGTITAGAQITHDVRSNYATAAVTVTDSDNRETVNITQSETDYGTHLLTLPGVFCPPSNQSTVDINGETMPIDVLTASRSSDTVHIYLISSGEPVNAEINTISDSQTVYEAVSPLKTSIKAIVWIKKANGTWDDQEIELKPITDHAYCWTFPGGGCVLDLANSNIPEQEDTITRAVEDYTTTGREYHAYRLKKSKKRNLSVSGAVVESLPKNGKWNDFDALLEAGHATFRNTRGEIIPVVVSEISRPISHVGWTEIKITQKQESR